MPPANRVQSPEIRLLELANSGHRLVEPINGVQTNVFPDADETTDLKSDFAKTATY
jgi:hypothetical protein